MAALVKPTLPPIAALIEAVQAVVAECDDRPAQAQQQIALWVLDAALGPAVTAEAAVPQGLRVDATFTFRSNRKPHHDPLMAAYPAALHPLGEVLQLSPLPRLRRLGDLATAESLKALPPRCQVILTCALLAQVQEVSEEAKDDDVLWQAAVAVVLRASQWPAAVLAPVEDLPVGLFDLAQFGLSLSPPVALRARWLEARQTASKVVKTTDAVLRDFLQAHLLEDVAAWWHASLVRAKASFSVRGLGVPPSLLRLPVDLSREVVDEAGAGGL